MKNLLLNFFKMCEPLTKNLDFVPFGAPFCSLPRPILAFYIIP